MTREEARLYFQENEDLDEKYESLLFECKQLLINRLPTTKLFEAKLLWLKSNSEAFAALGGQEFTFIPPKTGPSRYSSNKVAETVAEHYLESNRLKLLLFNSHSFLELKYNCNQLILNFNQYALKWAINLDGIKVDNIKISTVPDPMSILNAVELFNQAGLKYFSEISRNENDNLLLKESIRLSLWLKFEENV